MKAVVCTRYGPPDVLRLEEVKRPILGDDEVLIRVRATSVTAADYRIRGSNFPPLLWLPGRIMFGLKKPKKTILGMNLAREVEAVGKDVRRFGEGDRVFGSSGGRFGAYAEYVCLPEEVAVATKPDNVTYEEAATIPFGVFIPVSGEAFTATYTSRSIVTFLDFLEKVEAWVPESVGTVYAIMDNLRAHKAYDVLFFSLAHPRWEFVFQPKYAAYLNLIEPWWKTLRSLAIKGRFFESWEQIEEAIERALDYWNEHRHPYVWGRRRRHRRARKPGIGAMPAIPTMSS